MLVFWCFIFFCDDCAGSIYLFTHGGTAAPANLGRHLHPAGLHHPALPVLNPCPGAVVSSVTAEGLWFAAVSNVLYCILE